MSYVLQSVCLLCNIFNRCRLSSNIHKLLHLPSFYYKSLMCQYRPTSLCTKTHVSVHDITDQFCVNGGLCNTLVAAEERHPGCTCEEGKWEGKHCEFEHGILYDDALDLFQQRKTEIAMTRSIHVNDGLKTTTTTTTLGDGGGNAETSTSMRGIIPLPYVVGAAVVFVAVSLGIVKTSMLAIHNSRKEERRRDNGGDYKSSSGVVSISSRTTKMTLLSTSSSFLPPPPADVFLASRKKEVVDTVDEETSFILSPGESTPGHDIYDEQDTCSIEELDDETSRMIEAQLSQEDEGSRHYLVMSEEDGGEDEEEEEPAAVYAESYESDDESAKQQQQLVASRITSNKGQNPLSHLHADSSSEVSVHEHEEMMLVEGSHHGLTIVDGECHGPKSCYHINNNPDEEEDDTYFV